MPGVVADTINREPAITASAGFPITTHASVRFRRRWRAGPVPRQPGPRPYGMRRLRSENSATGKSEGRRSELRRSHALRMSQPRAGALAHGKRDATQAIGDLRRREEDAWRIHGHYLVNQITRYWRHGEDLNSLRRTTWYWRTRATISNSRARRARRGWQRRSTRARWSTRRQARPAPDGSEHRGM
jgi:hypothetical protein